jgi:hypothetical protein
LPAVAKKAARAARTRFACSVIAALVASASPGLAVRQALVVVENLAHRGRGNRDDAPHQLRQVHRVVDVEEVLIAQRAQEHAMERVLGADVTQHVRGRRAAHERRERA